MRNVRLGCGFRGCTFSTMRPCALGAHRSYVHGMKPLKRVNAEYEKRHGVKIDVKAEAKRLRSRLARVKR